MRALTAFVFALGISVGTVAVAGPHDPTPQKVDPNPNKADVVVLKDAKDNIYVVVDPWSTKAHPQVFSGTGKALYQQLGANSSRSETDNEWEMNMWAPRIPDFRPATIRHHGDGSFTKACDGNDDGVLTELKGPKAAEVMAKSTFYTPYLTRASWLLGRDDTAVYYYVDHLRPPYGSEGYRLFVGKKGVLKELALTDVVIDRSGELYITKTGTLKVANEPKAINETQFETIRHMTWIKGERKTELTALDLDSNSQLVYGGLGVYARIGTICDDI